MRRIDIKPCAIRGRKILHGKRTEYGKKIRKAYESHAVSESRSNIQRLEPGNDGICNAITTVQKDSMYIGKVIRMETRTKKMKPIKRLSRKHEKIIDLWNRQYIRERYCSKSEIDKYLYKDFGIFKLTARECLRLQGVAENDIDAMASVNSQSQLYKQAGNSITVSVLCAVFSQLGIKGVKKWNDMSFDEHNDVARKGIKLFEDSETELSKKIPCHVGIKQATKQGYIKCRVPGVADFSYPTSGLRRGRVQHGGGGYHLLLLVKQEYARY